MICFLFLSLWNEWSRKPQRIQNPRSENLSCREPCTGLLMGEKMMMGVLVLHPPCCCGCQWGWYREDNSAHGYSQSRECSQEHWPADGIQPPLPGWQSKCCSVAHREHVCAGRRGSELNRFDHRASKGGGSALMLVLDLKKVRGKNGWGQR